MVAALATFLQRLFVGSFVSVPNSDSKLRKASIAVHSGNNFRLDVQGLRAIAVLAVMAYHVNNTWLSAGFIGVDVFFVISGFIITTLLAERGANFNFLEFYAGRVRRIMPAYFVMLAIVCIVSAVLFLPADYEFFEDSLKSSVLFVSNNYFSSFGGYFTPRVDELPLLHTWSLGVEMQFYLFFYIGFVCLPRAWRLPIIVLLSVIFFAWSGCRASAGKQDALYFSLLARVPEFMVGSFVALLFRNYMPPNTFSVILGGAGAILLVGAFLIINKQHFPGAWSVLPCIGVGLLIVARQGPVSQLLASRPLVWIGTISYSLYLWHWPILAFIRYYTGQYEISFIGVLAFLLVSFLLAWLSYRYIETPARVALGPRQQALRWMLVIGGAVLAGVVGRQLNLSAVAPIPVELTRYAAPELICHGVQVGECKRGNVDAEPSVLVIGDSHAAQLNYFFDVAGGESGLAYQILTGSSCVPIAGFDLKRLPTWAQRPCQIQIDAVEKLLPKYDKIIVAGMWQLQMQSPEFVQAMRVFLVNASLANKQVALLAQVPMFESNVQRLRRFKELGFPAPLRLNSQWQAANQHLQLLAKEIPNVQFTNFSSDSFFANAPYQGEELIYYDSHHLNEVGARRYGHFASSQVQRLFERPRSSVSLQP